ncbi:hypothetical protein [uncultured Dokdonia sp.]|uniref:hypothetical protein n=1 Tax=uncultured Dokdonia sp. TaxID=575653 RepID=UPI002629D2D4|nr:hypothetical protein [uncultured Dokdonia sp.]
MSGPKVVRIVTPQERQIIRDRWLSRLAQAIQKFTACAKENELLDEELEKGLTKTLAHYQNLSAEDYQKIEREIPDQINYLQEERKKLKKRVITKRTSDWEQFKNLKSTHNELIALLIEKNIVFKDFSQPKTISKEQLKSYQIQIDGLYNALLKESSTSLDTLSEDQTAIQRRLSKGDSMLSVSTWKSKLPTTQTRLAKLEKTLEDMYVNDISHEKIQALMARCALLDESVDNYDMQLDSIIIDAADFSKNELALREAREELSNAIHLIESLGRDFNFIPQWKEKINSIKLQDILETAYKANQFYDQVSEELIADARRNAIKTALEKAGYEINDTMETAWVENGRLVVKKATNSLYGVEFMSPKNLSRIQARVVADEDRANERSPSLDKNQEEIWCDDFGAIRALLAEEGLDIIIDKMQEPGAVKLKEVALNSGYEARKQTINKRKQQ